MGVHAMKTPLKAATVIGVAALAVATFSYGIHIHREFQSKAEWSVLQAADFNNRQSSDASNLVLVSDASYHLVGVINKGVKPALSQPPKVDRVWILLDSKYPPVVKALAAEGNDFTISRTEFDKIMGYARVDPKVASLLSKHVR
jgi:hypothetical protein